MTALSLNHVGVFDDMPVEDYHAHPALSSSGARDILPPHCPAYFQHRRAHPESRPEFELGHAAHQRALGVGPELVLVDRDRWDTNEVKTQVAEIRARGAVPLKRAPYEGVQRMANALRSHPIAGPLLNPEHGQAELSLFWTDPATGVDCRARLDWLRRYSGGRVIVVDYKTTVSAAPDVLPRTLNSYGYHQQGAWYLDGAQACGLAGDDAVFVLVFQEKTPPYLVNVVQPDPPALRIGRARNAEAREIFRDCTASDAWPGYPAEVAYVSLPPWAELREDI